MDHVYRSFYTKNSAITAYMVDMIHPAAADRILEPCGGDGVFIDALLEYNSHLAIDTCDLNGEAVSVLKRKYAGNPAVSIRQADTLTDERFDCCARSGYYDKIIGNPPYGGWQEYDRRADLKTRYPGYYVRETYALFLLRCVSMLRDRGLLSFIIPDTFLYLHNHTALRDYLLTGTKIKEILIFPSNVFPGVSFGYSKLSIITLEKTSDREAALHNTFQVVSGLKTDGDIQRISRRRDLSGLELLTLRQSDVRNQDRHAFVLSNDGCGDILANASAVLGDLADCVTGIYTGDNKTYLALLRPTARGSGDYPLIPETDVDFACRSLTGTAASFRYIPLVKGSSGTKYKRCGHDWLINWTPAAVSHYREDKKARFQNTSYYFRTGIAVPMVKSSKINATLMEGCVFDQSIVGVFPREEAYLYYLLGFLNSDVANRLIHLINPTANNSSNYLKKLPVVLPQPEDLAQITGLVKTILETGHIGEEHKHLNAIFNRIFGLEE